MGDDAEREDRGIVVAPIPSSDNFHDDPEVSLVPFVILPDLSMGSQALNCSVVAVRATILPACLGSQAAQANTVLVLLCISLRSSHALVAVQRWDVVIVGAGVAGSALAFSQGRVRHPPAAGVKRRCHTQAEVRRKSLLFQQRIVSSLV
jgi:hypothetical protein